MENINLFLLRIILASIILHIAAAKSIKGKETQTNGSSKLEIKQQDLKIHHLEDSNHASNIKNLAKDHHKALTKNKRKKLSKKSKRDAYNNYSKNWTSRSNFGYGGYPNNMPLYLVYNRKIGAYFPYYKYPKENNVRRNGNFRKVPNQ